MAHQEGWQVDLRNLQCLGTPHALHRNRASARAQGKRIDRFAGTLVLSPPLNQGQAADMGTPLSVSGSFLGNSLSD
jgi:hypothetical protein